MEFCFCWVNLGAELYERLEKCLHRFKWAKIAIKVRTKLIDKYYHIQIQPILTFFFGCSTSSILFINHCIAASRLFPYSFIAQTGNIAQFLFILFSSNLLHRFYTFIVAMSLLFAKTKTTAFCICSCDIILFSSYLANYSLS